MSPITRQYRTIPDTAPPDSSTHEEHVTWQFVFWALVVIALNCTTQSSNILSWRRDLSPAITPFLRTSPFLCMGDAVASIIRLVSYCAVLRVSPARAVRLLAATRFEINVYYRIEGFGSNVPNITILRSPIVLNDPRFSADQWYASYKQVEISPGDVGKSFVASLYTGDVC
jgi:hypothetical protein